MSNTTSTLRLLIKTLLTVGIISAVWASPVAQTKQLAIGDTPPPLYLEKLLQAPPDAKVDWDTLKGKVIVLDFWATWCKPCVEAIPHLNQLANDLADQPVVFISVTDDAVARAQAFLKTTPMKSWIGIDTNRQNWARFSVPSISHTIIIGPDGKVKAITLPENVSAQALRDVLAGKAIALPLKETGVKLDLEWDQNQIEWKDGIKPLVQILIKPVSTELSGSMRSLKGDYLTGDGVLLEVLLQIAYGTDHYHIDWRLPASTQTYRFAARVPPGRESHVLPLLQNTLAATFNLKATWQPQEKDVYVLRVSDNELVKRAAAAADQESSFQMMRGTATAKRKPLADLTEFLTNALRLLVVDETGLLGDYNWELPYQPGQPDVTLQALKDRLGLKLVKGRRSVKMLVVEPAEASKAP
jgi:uncharacterized protein (TIGR03435 family)